MISKLVVWGDDRASAVARMRRALDEYQVRGIETNLAFHRLALRHPDFIAGKYDTGFIGREHAALTPRAEGAALDAAMIAAALDATARSAPVTAAPEAASGAPSGPSAWRTGARGWRGV